MSFSGLYIGLSALRTHQAVQELVGQNVANVNTPGYSRRIAYLVPLNAPANSGTGPQAGLGVALADIRRSADTLLNRQIQREGATYSYWSAMRDGMSEVEGLFQEPGSTGLSSLMDGFWASWKDLSVDPTVLGSRINVRQAGEALISSIRRTYQGIQDFATGMNARLRTQVQQINVLADEIAQVNRQIAQAMSSGDPANDLCDYRDVLLEELATLCNARSAVNNDGSMTVMLDGHLLVGSHGATHLKVEIDSTGFAQPAWTDDNSFANLREGELGATLQLREWALDKVLPELNRLTAHIIDTVNTLHMSGYCLEPPDRTGVAFFSGSSAADIAISDDVANDLSAIAAAEAPNSPGDGRLALKIGALQQELQAALGDSINGAYAAYIADLGLNVRKAYTMTLNQEALVSFLNSRREDITGVSLDEEAVQLMASQRAYQAASRVITAFDEMLDRLINQTGMVGR